MREHLGDQIVGHIASDLNSGARESNDVQNGKAGAGQDAKKAGTTPAGKGESRAASHSTGKAVQSGS
jgi:hypothetical protein